MSGSKADAEFDDELDALLEDTLGAFDNVKIAQPPAPQPAATAKPQSGFQQAERAQQYATQLYAGLADRPDLTLLLDNLLSALNFSVASRHTQPQAQAQSQPLQPASTPTTATPTTATSTPTATQSEKRDMSATMSHAFDELKRTAAAQSAEMPMPDLDNIGEAELEEMMKTMLGNTDELMPMMEDMMANLFAKDVMYPSLLEIGDKYAPYIEQNRSKLSAQQISNYQSQHRCIRDMCALYETNGLDSKVQTERIMAIMQQMQEYGTPPEGIAPPMPSMGGGLGLGAQDAQCVVM